MGAAAMKPRRQKWRVEWVNPESRQWETYQAGLARARADRLAHTVRYVLGPRWFGHNPSTRVVEDAAP